MGLIRDERTKHRVWVDGENKPHREEGPAIEMSDGDKLWVRHGEVGMTMLNRNNRYNYMSITAMAKWVLVIQVSTDSKGRRSGKAELQDSNDSPWPRIMFHPDEDRTEGRQVNFSDRDA